MRERNIETAGTKLGLCKGGKEGNMLQASVPLRYCMENLLCTILHEREKCVYESLIKDCQHQGMLKARGDMLISLW